MRLGKMISTILQQDPLGVAGTPSGKNLREMITELSGKVEAKEQARKKPGWLSAIQTPLTAGPGMLGSMIDRLTRGKTTRKDIATFGESAPRITMSLRTRGYDEKLIQEYIDKLAEWYGAEKLDISKIKI